MFFPNWQSESTLLYAMFFYSSCNSFISGKFFKINIYYNLLKQGLKASLCDSAWCTLHGMALGDKNNLWDQTSQRRNPYEQQNPRLYKRLLSNYPLL